MTEPPTKSSRRRKWLVRAIVVIVVLLIAGELFARFYLGLGDPILYLSDPQIEYLPRPSRSYQRLGHTVSFNSFSMRGDEFPVKKTNLEELRIMVLGDSVVTAGSRINQPDVATEVLRRTLMQELRRPVVVGNIGANSWGPANLLAYVQRFGLFDADVVIIVLNGWDAVDVPTFEPLDAEMPSRSPVLALEEVVRIWPKRLMLMLRSAPPPKDEHFNQKDIDSSLGALRELLDVVLKSGAKLIVIQHFGSAELAGEPGPGQALIASVAADANVQTIPDAPALIKADPTGRGAAMFADHIHPNEAGQHVLADVMAQAVRAALTPAQKPAPAPPPAP